VLKENPAASCLVKPQPKSYQANFQVINAESLTFSSFNPKENGRRGRFVSRQTGRNERFVYGTGKEFEGRRIKFMKIKITLLIAFILTITLVGFAQRKKTTAAAAPDAVVKNLYNAPGTQNPFFQTKSRALVDKYFTKDFADMIWKDAIESNGEVGALGFDPLYNAQDTQITLFKVGKPMYGEGNLDVADVPVTFKNMGKSETILFRLERDARKIWKISDIYYPNSKAKRMIRCARFTR
jgi:hypothetical protein